MQTKKCTWCCNILPLSDFHRCSRNADGLKYRCKKCRSQTPEGYAMKRLIEKNRELSKFGCRVCFKCHQEKSLNNFYIKKNREPRSRCKECEMVDCAGSQEKRDEYLKRKADDEELMKQRKRRCTKCNKVKEFSEYYSFNSKPRHTCKKCYNKQQYKTYHQDIERSRKMGRIKRKNNPKAYTAISKRYHQTLKGKVSRKMAEMSRRARLKNCKSEDYSDKVAHILSFPIFKCHYCGLFFSTDYFTIDHKLALANGGDDLWSNILPACIECNQAKGTTLYEDFDAYADYVKLTT